MTKLTEWDTGLPIYVDRSAIKSVRRLAAEPANDTLDFEATEERTRVDTATDMFLVRETPEEVLGIETGVSWGPRK
jgi:nucleoid-associated protein YejK